MVTFRVSDVDAVVSRLPTVTAEVHLAALGWKTTEAHRLATTAIVSGPLVHPLALAVDLAFAQHRPLRLTPDAVWLCLAQGLASHVEQNAEALRSRLVRHDGVLSLEQRRDDFRPGDRENDWPAAVEGLVSQVRGHLGKRADLFVADFSTTGPLERTASQIALLGAMRQYFRYSVATLCGIPEITLAGTPADWASIRERVQVFRELDLGWWVDVLEPIMASLEATSRGDVDREFWRRLYKVEHQSGGDRSTGWLTALFPYVGDPLVRNHFPSTDADDFAGLKLSDLPPGRTRAPFTWRIMAEEFPMELVGGLWGVTQDDAGVLDVVPGWVVSAARTDSGFVRMPGDREDPRWPDQLHPRPGTTVTSLEALRHEAGDEPVALSIWNASGLDSLDGIEHLRGLVELSIGEATFASAAPLADLRGLRRLDLRNCKALRNLGPVLEALPDLESLCLMGNADLSPADFRPIAKMEKLSYLVLWHCNGVPESIRRAIHDPREIAEARALLA